ncbi:SDR family NAD(P)-dependent oxidoreductase [Rhodosalinus halophilus]|uniref:SDR family NAD(P)-dependent oxidoreductase n=1 Tax=Rhodosalinus halophilus TaxID=2259333 RepID=A0A365U9R0_9RHOB|nr:SDR family oxidoreductase [Rhodosalinus halophilus]RBI85471.1 SDR family NAD(P)-dependent oxidoreductase [Rhodosalinus halophilus]
MDRVLLSLGHGYSARALARLLAPQGWRIIGTTRSAEKADRLAAEGVEPLIWPGADLRPALADATHLLSSVGPDAEGDPVLRAADEAIAEAAPHLEWAGYLSTTGVYGDHQGRWVDETTPPAPAKGRSDRRLEAERAWAAVPGLPLHVFRLSGIYGPGRSALDRLRAGTARRIVKEGQVFSRIHVDDIAQVLAASIARPNPGAVYNVADDEPAPADEVIAYAAELLGLPVPRAIPFEEAELSPMAAGFYAESRRVRNDRIKRELGVRLLYPDYRAGLQAILAAEKAGTV